MSSRIRDGAFLLGLGLVAAGAAQFSLGAALLVVGSVLIVLACVGWWGSR